MNSSTRHIECTNLAPAGRHPTGDTGWSPSNMQAQNPPAMRQSGLQVPALKKHSKNNDVEAIGTSFFPFGEHRYYFLFFLFLSTSAAHALSFQTFR